MTCIHCLQDRGKPCARKSLPLLGIDCSIQALTTYVITSLRQYQLHPPVLLEDHAVAAQQETQIDVSGDFDRFIPDPSRPFYVPGTKVILEVPFEGDADFFKVRPSTWTTTLPVADVRDNTLLLSVSGTDLTSADTKSQFARLTG